MTSHAKTNELDTGIGLFTWPVNPNGGRGFGNHKCMSTKGAMLFSHTVCLDKNDWVLLLNRLMSTAWAWVKQGRDSKFHHFHHFFIFHTTAPPPPTHTSPNEGSILLALSAFQAGQFKSVRAAAAAFTVSAATLQRRVNGRASRDGYTQPGKKLNSTEEEGLLDTILSLDRQGLVPSISLVREMASIICRARGEDGVGTKWASNFVKKTPGLNTRIGRSYECQRRKCEDPAIIADWFR